jgi:hypothetical protein
MLRDFVIDGHDTITLTSLSPLYRFVNVLNIWSLFLLLNTFCQAWSRIVTLCHELLYILGFDLYTVPMTCLLNITQCQYITLLNPW